MRILTTEINFIELDNEMEDLSFCSEGEILADDESMKEIIESGCIVYTSSLDDYNTVTVNFTVESLADIEEGLDSTIIKVTSIDGDLTRYCVEWFSVKGEVGTNEELFHDLDCAREAYENECYQLERSAKEDRENYEIWLSSIDEDGDTELIEIFSALE